MTAPQDHPLGDITGNGETSLPADVGRSIVDELLDLNDFLSGDIRLAVTQAAFYTRPELEADITSLNAELDSITDSQGRPLTEVDPAVGDGERSVPVVQQELLAKQRQYAASRRVVLMQQLDVDDWTAFQEKWKEAMAGSPPYPPAFYIELITRCATNPKIDAENLAQLRKRVGQPAYDALWRSAWNVNTESGVSIPKSLLSSAVSRQQQRG